MTDPNRRVNARVVATVDGRVANKWKTGSIYRSILEAGPTKNEPSA